MDTRAYPISSSVMTAQFTSTCRAVNIRGSSAGARGQEARAASISSTSRVAYLRSSLALASVMWLAP